MSILHHEEVNLLHEWTVTKGEDPISTQTMTRSKARLSGNEEEERAQGEDIAPEDGNIDEEIDNYLDDIQAQPQVQPQALVQDPNYLDQILDRLDHMQRSFDEHTIYSRHQFTYLQEQITAFYTNPRHRSLRLAWPSW